MSIKWDAFKKNMVKYFESQKAGKESDVAKKLATEYDKAMKSGGDVVFGNSILKGNKKAFEVTFQKAFEGMKKGMPVPAATLLMGQASVLYWTGATLKIGVPPVVKLPPSTASITINTVIVPGLPVPIKLKNTSDTGEYVDNLISSFKKHLLTISGTTVAIIPSVPPVPTPFPFVGYK